MSAQQIHVLLAEDDEGDVELIHHSLKSSKLAVQFDSVCDGEACLKYLRKQAPYENSPTPDLIFLDLNMPKKDGREVLSIIKSDDAIKHIPVVILTTSEADADIQKTYKLGANCYVTKPVDFEQFQRVVNEIAEFWFTVVKLPDAHV